MKLIFALCIAGFAVQAMADQYVRGYVRRDGTYVEPHMRSSPNSSLYDNWSTKGNTNPYTGKEGTIEPDRVYGRSYNSGNSYDYGSGSTQGRRNSYESNCNPLLSKCDSYGR